MRNTRVEDDNVPWPHCNSHAKGGETEVVHDRVLERACVIIFESDRNRIIEVLIIIARQMNIEASCYSTIHVT